MDKDLLSIITGPILGFFVLVWFALCSRLFKILRTRHPEKYDALGRPSLVMNNTISNNIAFLKFLVNFEWQSMDDTGLRLLSKVMLAFGAFYIVLFVALIGLIANAKPL